VTYEWGEIYTEEGGHVCNARDIDMDAKLLRLVNIDMRTEMALWNRIPVVVMLLVQEEDGELAVPLPITLALPEGFKITEDILGRDISFVVRSG
jgi:uncharacterized protein (DUF111 family)